MWVGYIVTRSVLNRMKFICEVVDITLERPQRANFHYFCVKY